MLMDLQELSRQPAAERFRSRINALRRKVLGAGPPEALDMSRGLPYTPLHAEVWAANAPVQRAAGQRELAVWPGRCYGAPASVRRAPRRTPARAKCT